MPAFAGMEAAGIEPASRGMSSKVSTCVVRQLFLEADDAGEQASSASSSTNSSQRAAEQHGVASLLIVVWIPIAGVSGQTGSPKLGGHGQLVIGM